MFCKYCGNELKEGAEVCMKCGKYTNSANKKQAPMSIGGAKVLSLFFPIIGIIFYFIYKDEHEEFAKGSLMFAIIGFAISFAFGFLGGILSAFASF